VAVEQGREWDHEQQAPVAHEVAETRVEAVMIIVNRESNDRPPNLAGHPDETCSPEFRTL